MWTTKQTIKTKATKEQIWQLWSDVENWKKWDDETESSSLVGTFETGQYINIKPVGGPKSKCKLVEINEPHNFTVTASLPLAKMYFMHQLEEKEGELFITHSVEIRGLLTFLFSKIIGKGIAKNLAPTMQKLSEMAQKI